jgi:hypothetical protein
MNVVVQIIPHSEQRYPTVGDWWWEDDTLQIRVSHLGDWKMEMCAAYHEQFEALECRVKGITQEQVDAFDKGWQPHDGLDEPGDDVASPYFWQHQHATIAERQLAHCLGVSWANYEQAIEEVENGQAT